jgi:hypothetical protein
MTPKEENLKKLNYFEKLNEKAWKLRKQYLESGKKPKQQVNHDKVNTFGMVP